MHEDALSQRTRSTDRRPQDGATGCARWNVVVLGVSSVVVGATSFAARADLTPVEVTVFRSLNELSDALNTAIWPFMQYGTFVTIPALTVIALLFSRFRLAIALALSGVGVYLLARLVKEIVERGRPGAVLTGVEAREVFAEGSLGFPSGHAAVAAALTVVVAAHLSMRWTITALVLGTIVLFGRLYVGAHLPLDVLGGAALGAVTGSAVNMAMCRRRGRMDVEPRVRI